MIRELEIEKKTADKGKIEYYHNRKSRVRCSFPRYNPFAKMRCCWLLQELGGLSDRYGENGADGDGAVGNVYPKIHDKVEWYQTISYKYDIRV